MDEEAFLLAQRFAEEMQRMGREEGHPVSRVLTAAAHAAAATIAGLSAEPRRIDALRRAIQIFEKAIEVEERRLGLDAGDPPTRTVN